MYFNRTLKKIPRASSIFRQNLSHGGSVLFYFEKTSKNLKRLLKNVKKKGTDFNIDGLLKFKSLNVRNRENLGWLKKYVEYYMNKLSFRHLVAMVVVVVMLIVVLWYRTYWIEESNQDKLTPTVTIVMGNSVPNTNRIDDSLCKNANIVKFNHHWLLSPDTFSKDMKYTVVVHNASTLRTFSELKKQNMFGSVGEIVVFSGLNVNSTRKITDWVLQNTRAMKDIDTYKDDIGPIPIRIVSKEELIPVYQALYKKGFPKSNAPRTGIAYIMWLLLQKHKVFINGFDIDGTDATTHAFENVKVDNAHNVHAEGKLLKSLIQDGSITKL